MKAYEARNKWGYRDYATVVFAESAGKARAIALYTEACEGCDFTDIEVFRVPILDKYYQEGKVEMDWTDTKMKGQKYEHKVHFSTIVDYLRCRCCNSLWNR